MEVKNKATKIDLFSLATPHMRTFHMTWFAFFVCFFGWFGIAPLMALVREDLMLTKEQIGNTIIASVAITVLVRIIIGPLCDRFGARLTYTWLLLLGSLPIMGIGLADSYESFLFFRLAIGAIGASFVITQYHTSIMFAPNVVGTANATTAGWGNLGGGVTQMIMPLILACVMFFGINEAFGWRLAMLVPGAILFLTGIGYYYFTQDAPDGNYKDLRAKGEMPPAKGSSWESFLLAAKDYRVWALFAVYAACFGVELTINNVAALYYHDYFKLNVVPFINKKALGGVAGIVGAGGNAGAVSAGFLFRSESLSTPEALMWVGACVCVASACTFLIKFSPAVVEEEHKALQRALAEREALAETKPKLVAA